MPLSSGRRSNVGFTSALWLTFVWTRMRVSMIVVVFFCVRTRRLRRILPPFPTRFRPRQYIRRLSGRRRSDRPGNMLLLLARHVDFELSFGSSSNQPSPYCSEKRSLHLQLEKRTLLSSLDRSACFTWTLALPRKHCAQPQRAASARAAGAGDSLATESTGTILVPRQMSKIAGHALSLSFSLCLVNRCWVLSTPCSVPVDVLCLLVPVSVGSVNPCVYMLSTDCWLSCAFYKLQWKSLRLDLLGVGSEVKPRKHFRRWRSYDPTNSLWTPMMKESQLLRFAKKTISSVFVSTC